MLYCFEENNKNLNLGNLHYIILRTLLDFVTINYPSMLYTIFINNIFWMAVYLTQMVVVVERHLVVEQREPVMVGMDRSVEQATPLLPVPMV